MPSGTHSNLIQQLIDFYRLNEVIVTESHDAKLVILNLPGPPKKNPSDVDGPNKYDPEII